MMSGTDADLVRLTCVDAEHSTVLPCDMLDHLRHLEALARRQAALICDRRTKLALLELADEYRARIEHLEQTAPAAQQRPS